MGPLNDLPQYPGLRGVAGKVVPPAGAGVRPCRLLPGSTSGLRLRGTRCSPCLRMAWPRWLPAWRCIRGWLLRSGGWPAGLRRGGQGCGRMARAARCAGSALPRLRRPRRWRERLLPMHGGADQANGPGACARLRDGITASGGAVRQRSLIGASYARDLPAISGTPSRSARPAGRFWPGVIAGMTRSSAATPSDCVHGVHLQSARCGSSEVSDIAVIGWGTWIRTKTVRVRVGSSTVKLFPNGQRGITPPRR